MDDTVLVVYTGKTYVSGKGHLVFKLYSDFSKILTFDASAVAKLRLSFSIGTVYRFFRQGDDSYVLSTQIEKHHEDRDQVAANLKEIPE